MTERMRRTNIHFLTLCVAKQYKMSSFNKFDKAKAGCRNGDYLDQHQDSNMATNMMRISCLEYSCLCGIIWTVIYWLINRVLMPLSAVFQLYHGDQFLVVEEAGVTGENHRPWASNW